MFNFFTNKILNRLRNRSYFQSFTTSGVIESEGAWRITIINNGNAVAELTDGGGNVCLIAGPTVPNLASVTSHLILGGEPYIIRDDIIKVDFQAGLNPSLCVIYDRLVSKKETNNYPQDSLMSEG